MRQRTAVRTRSAQPARGTMRRSPMRMCDRPLQRRPHERSAARAARHVSRRQRPAVDLAVDFLPAVVH
jgi:hypothetical protein